VEGRFRPLGFWKLTPFLKVLPARDQLNYLRHIQPAVPIAPLSRTHFLAWPPGFDVLFRQLHDAGIALDSSYGPDKDTRGYLFGTARPFRPLSDTGLPFDLLELPFCSAENLGGADLAYFEQAFRLSEEGAHQVISPLFHPNSFAWHPDMRNYATWKDLPELAQSASHRLMTLGGLLEFEQARQSSALSVLDESSTLRLKVLPLHVDLRLRVPAVWRQRPLAEVEGAADFSCAHWDMGSRVCLVRLLPGETELTLTYGPTPASPSP
jgi:hypothetical protein